MDGTLLLMEKDHWKISLACLVSLVPFLLNIFLLQIRQSIAANKEVSDAMMDLTVTLKVPIYHFSQISEELCLTIICADFRRLCRCQFRSIFGWTFWCISLGRWKLMKENHENKVAVTECFDSCQHFGQNSSRMCNQCQKLINLDDHIQEKRTLSILRKEKL